MTIARDLILLEWQCFAGCHLELPLHQIEASNEFRNRMFDLQPGIHLNEIPRRICIERAALNEELNRTSAFIANRPANGDSRIRHLAAQLQAHSRGRRLFDHLLMPTLQRTIAFKQMDNVALAVAKDLHLNMPRSRDQLFEQHLAIAE